MTEPAAKARSFPSKPSRFPWQLLLVFLILSSGLFLISEITYNQQKKTIRDSVETELSALAGMKTGRISEWRKDWLAVSNFIFENTYLAERTQDLLDNVSPDDSRRQILDGLAALRRNFPFERAVLNLAGGRTILTYPEGISYQMNPEVVDIGHRAYKSRMVIVGDLYQDQETNRFYVGLIIPIIEAKGAEENPVALLNVDIDPAGTLFPLLVPDTEESRVYDIRYVRREGDDFIILNAPGGPMAGSLLPRIPVSSFDFPDVKAALDFEGPVEGRSPEGAPVLAVIKPVPGFSGYLLVERDMRAINAEMSGPRKRLLVFAALLILVSGVILGLFWARAGAARKADEKKRWDESNANMLEFLRHIIEIMPNPAFFKDTEGRYLGCNAAFERSLGYPKEKILGKTIRDVAPEEISADHEKIDNELLARPGYRIYESNLKAYDGEHQVIFIKTTYTQPDGTLGGILGILKDITQRRRAEDELEQLRKFSDGTIQTMTEGLVLTDADGKFTFVNPAAAAILGYEPGELIDKEAKSFVAGKDHHLVDEANERRAHGLSDRYELDFLHKDGSVRTLLVSGGPRVRGTQLGGTLAVLTDITERKRMEEEIKALSLTDELTKLYNRRGFVTLAGQQIKTAVRMKKKILLIYMDVDNLKTINDTGGHQAGDKALADVAYVLKKNFRDSDIVGRLGGDEFAVLAMETTRMKPEVLTGRLDEKISIYNASIGEGTGFKLSLSWGCVMQDPEAPILLDEMISRADGLMYKQKREKKARRGS